jgi:hypothetical protein
MSAATMMVCACDELVLGKHSQLGPTDPQVTVRTGEVVTSVPARAVIEQFKAAKDECAANPKFLPTWLPILRTFAPALPELCAQAEERASELVGEWLNNYLMKGLSASAVAEAKNFLTTYEHRSHGRPLYPSILSDNGIPFTSLENDDKLQDLVLSVFHATTICFDMTTMVKVAENHLGTAFLKTYTPQAAAGQGQKPVPKPLPARQPPSKSRAARASGTKKKRS